MDGDTHYVLDFRRGERGSQPAVCGVRIWTESFSASPSCPHCKEWLARDQQAFERTANDATPAATVRRRRPEPDPVEEYEAEYRQRFGGRR